MFALLFEYLLLLIYAHWCKKKKIVPYCSFALLNVYYCSDVFTFSQMAGVHVNNSPPIHKSDKS